MSLGEGYAFGASHINDRAAVIRVVLTNGGFIQEQFADLVRLHKRGEWELYSYDGRGFGVGHEEFDGSESLLLDVSYGSLSPDEFVRVWAKAMYDAKLVWKEIDHDHL